MSEETVTFSLNEKEVTVPKGTTVMEAARKFGVYIPHFCWHPGLSVAGVCRFCMVKVEGRPKLEIACNLTATPGMKVSTELEEVKDAHKWALEFHLVNHPLDCPICDQAGECKLQDYYMEVGKYQSQMERPKVLKPKALDIGDDLVLDTERCILCDRCVRFEEQVTKTGALGIFNRGDRAVVGTFPGKRIDHQYQTNLVDICPVGAFTSKDFRFKQRVWFLKDKKATCPGCSTGCQVNVYAKPEVRTYFRIKPRESAVNGHWMCDQGRSTYKHLNQEERLRSALVTVQGQRKRVSTEEALKNLSLELTRFEKEEIGLLVSPQYTCEEYDAFFNYFVTKLGIKKVYQWREPTENRTQFDGVLLRGDRNPNTLGLQKALKKVGLNDAIENGFEEACRSSKALIALCPELPETFPSIEQQMAKLELLPFVSMWSVTQKMVQRKGIKHAVPLKGFAEKTGTYLNFEGVEGVLAEPFPCAVDDAKDVSEVVGRLVDMLR